MLFSNLKSKAAKGKTPNYGCNLSNSSAFE
jgi:hypothetical protein